MDVRIVSHTEFEFAHNRQVIADKKAIIGDEVNPKTKILPYLLRINRNINIKMGLNRTFKGIEVV